MNKNKNTIIILALKDIGTSAIDPEELSEMVSIATEQIKTLSGVQSVESNATEIRILVDPEYPKIRIASLRRKIQTAAMESLTVQFADRFVLESTDIPILEFKYQVIREEIL